MPVGENYSIRPLSEPLESVSDRWRDLVRHLPAGVNLLAVSKGHSADSIRTLVDLGQRDFGESRLQEALPKLEALADQRRLLRWHFVGGLQANKVRGVVKHFEVIHSVDSKALAERISRIAGEENRCPRIFLQVKLRQDPSKGGMTLEQIRELWPLLHGLPNLSVIGLMTMAPLGSSKEQCLEVFRDCRALADELSLPDCSMGMSGDWREAVSAGGTWLRLGSSIFGDKS